MPDIEAREAFPKILAAYMEQHNMKQTDVARSVHVSKQIVSDWLRGKKFPRVDKMQELADLFGVLMSDMYTPRTYGMTNNVKIRVKGERTSLAQAIVKANVINNPDQNFEITLRESMPTLNVLDQDSKAMIKLWKVATPEAKKAAIGVLKSLNKPIKK